MKARLALTIGLFSFHQVVVPCCGVGPANSPPIQFLGQRNIIIWDEDTKTEQFIRSAGFQTNAKDFGFIAPTPTIPQISEVDKAAFVYLDGLSPKRPPGPLRGGRGGSNEPIRIATPLVLQVKEVGGYLATTLKATDARGLAAWMKQNGYTTSPSIQKWTEFYIKKKWYLTAFKVINKDGAPQTGTIKLKFKTEMPFNPYFVPKDNIPQTASGTGLSIHFISDKRMQIVNPLPGTGIEEEWATRMSKTEAAGLRKLVKDQSLSEGLWVQYFYDSFFPDPRSKDDLYFEELNENPTLIPTMFSKFLNL